MNEKQLALIFVAGVATGMLIKTQDPAAIILVSSIIYSATRAALGLFGKGNNA